MPSDQSRALDSDGYIVLRQALDGDWVARLQRAFQYAEQERGTQHVRIGTDTVEREAWEQVPQLPLLVAAVAHVLDAANLREYHGRNPLPGHGQQGLHTDAVQRGPGTPFQVVSAMAMLDPFRPENGATRIVPGSHLLTTPIPRALAQPLAHHPDERVVVGEAGDILVFNGHLWHSGTRNNTPDPRRAIQMVFSR